jgi:glycerol uptake facilitator-like aquaporin
MFISFSSCGITMSNYILPIYIHMNKYLAEFIGTFFLVLVVGLTGNPVAIGLTLALMVYTFASTSGSNFNPAVSFGLWINQKLSNYDFPRYVLSQLLGGALAVLVFRFVMKKSMEVLLPADTTVLMGIALEALFTFLFVTVIYNVTVKVHI